MKIYPASKARPAELALWTALRGAGLPLVADWIDSPINRIEADDVTPDMWARLWQRNLEQAAAADICLFYAPEGLTQCGSLIEIGCALQSGKEIWIVSDYKWTIANLPQCRVFKNIESAVVAAVARMKGDEARLDMLARCVAPTCVERPTSHNTPASLSNPS
jgi:hypothetical protein